MVDGDSLLARQVPELGHTILTADGVCLNLFTGETAQPPDALGEPLLRFDALGFGFLSGGGQEIPLRDAFERIVCEAEGSHRLSWVAKSTGRTDVVKLSAAARYFPMHLVEGEVSQLKVWSLSHCAPGVSCWWSLLSVVPVLRGSEASGCYRRYIANHWGQRTRYVQNVCPPPLALRKGLDPKGLDQHWHRMFPVPTCSTAGLLTMLLALGWSVASACMGRRALEVGGQFVGHFLKDVDADLLILFDARAHQSTWVGSPPDPEKAETVALQGGCLCAAELLGKTPIALRPPLPECCSGWSASMASPTWRKCLCSRFS